MQALLRSTSVVLGYAACFGLLVLLTGCDFTPGPDPPVIESAFQPYVDRFSAEATERGVVVELHLLTVEFVPIIEDNGATFCGSAPTDGLYAPPRVIISSKPSCWDEKHDADREVLLFHELGHALLDRSHDDTRLPNGDWRSMMHTGSLNGLYLEERADSNRVVNAQKRRYYLDELFDRGTAVPDWALD